MGVKATHVLCSAYFVAFLVLVIGDGQAWHLGLLQALGVGDAAELAARPWTVLTHVLLHRDPLEGILAVGILLLAGQRVEERLGTAKFVAVYGLAASFLALAHVGLVEAGISPGRLLTGSLGPSCALLTAYLFLMPERRVGSMPYPFFFLVLTAGLLVAVGLIDNLHERALKKRADADREVALSGTNPSTDDRLELLGRANLDERLRPNHLAHLLGFALGGVVLGMTAAAGRYHDRHRMLREIRGLQEEVEVRARVEALLEKISRDGIGALSRAERKFLRYASRFYRGQPTGVPGNGASTADTSTADLA